MKPFNKHRTLLVTRVICSSLVISFLGSDFATAASLSGIGNPAVPPPSSMQSQVLADARLLETPSQFCHYKETYQAPAVNGIPAPLILLLQDAHANLSGQQNLAKTLEALIKQYDFKDVFVEGGEGDVSLGVLRELSDATTMKRVAGSFLREAEIAGEEYLNLTSSIPMKLTGVEDIALYAKGLKAYALLAKKREAILLYLGKSRTALDKLKKRNYPYALQVYEKKSLESPSTEALIELARDYGVDFSSYAQITRLAGLLDQEKKIDFNLARLELASIMEKIGDKDSGNLAQQLAAQPKEKNAAQSLLIQKVKKAALDHGVSLVSFPNFVKYAEYLEAFTAVSMEKTLDEISALEEVIYNRLLESKISQTLRAVDRYLKLLETAYRIQMTSDEFASFLENTPDFPTISWQAFLNRALVEDGIADSLIPLENSLEEGRTALEAFYRAVDERDFAFVQNIEKFKNENGNLKMAALIAGGYHTQHLSKLLREKGYSYVVLAPIVTQATDQAKYEKVLLSPLGPTSKTIETVNGRASVAGVDGSRAFVAAGREDFVGPILTPFRDQLPANVRKFETEFRGRKSRLASALSGKAGTATAELVIQAPLAARLASLRKQLLPLGIGVMLGFGGAAFTYYLLQDQGPKPTILVSQDQADADENIITGNYGGNWVAAYRVENVFKSIQGPGEAVIVDPIKGLTDSRINVPLPAPLKVKAGQVMIVTLNDDQRKEHRGISLNIGTNNGSAFYALRHFFDRQSREGEFQVVFEFTTDIEIAGFELGRYLGDSMENPAARDIPFKFERIDFANVTPLAQMNEHGLVEGLQQEGEFGVKGPLDIQDLDLNISVGVTNEGKIRVNQHTNPDNWLEYDPKYRSVTGYTTGVSVDPDTGKPTSPINYNIPASHSSYSDSSLSNEYLIHLANMSQALSTLLWESKILSDSQKAELKKTADILRDELKRAASGARLARNRRSFLKQSFAAVAAAALTPKNILGDSSSPSRGSLLLLPRESIVPDNFEITKEELLRRMQFQRTNVDKFGTPKSFLPSNEYWKSVGHDTDKGTVEELIERNLSEGFEIYDVATAVATEVIANNPNGLDYYVRSVAAGQYGKLQTTRANDPRRFKYNGKRPPRGLGAFGFRMIPRDGDYLLTDPLSDEREKTHMDGFPEMGEYGKAPGNVNRIHHVDWKAIAGEQAWDRHLSPLQKWFKKYGGRSIKRYHTAEIEIATGILEGFELMQSELGAIYHAPEGTVGKDPFDISTENNESIAMGLEMLIEVLTLIKNNRNDFKKGDAEKLDSDIERAKKLLYGDEVSGKKGIYDYFKNNAYDQSSGTLYQGGHYDPATKEFVPTTEIEVTDTKTGEVKKVSGFAVDVQTWAIAFFGPAKIDEWYGKGAASKMWEATKLRGGFYEDGILKGVGFTDHRADITNGLPDPNSVLSGEWTFGAIQAVLELARSAEKNGDTATAKNLVAEARSMRSGVDEHLRVELEGGVIAYLYANKRYYIPFGWWANKIPSLASTTWSIAVDSGFDFSKLGGGKYYKALFPDVAEPDEVTISAFTKDTSSKTNYVTSSSGDGQSALVRYVDEYESVRVRIYPKPGLHTFMAQVKIGRDSSYGFRRWVLVPYRLWKDGDYYDVIYEAKEVAKVISGADVLGVTFEEGHKTEDGVMNWVGENQEKTRHDRPLEVTFSKKEIPSPAMLFDEKPAFGPEPIQTVLGAGWHEQTFDKVIDLSQLPGASVVIEAQMIGDKEVGLKEDHHLEVAEMTATFELDDPNGNYPFLRVVKSADEEPSYIEFGKNQNKHPYSYRNGVTLTTDKNGLIRFTVPADLIAYGGVLKFNRVMLYVKVNETDQVIRSAIARLDNAKKKLIPSARISIFSPKPSGARLAAGAESRRNFLTTTATAVAGLAVGAAPSTARPDVVTYGINPQTGVATITVEGKEEPVVNLGSVVYQPTVGTKHISYYTEGNMPELLAALLPSNSKLFNTPGFQGLKQFANDDAKKLKAAGFNKIRLYYLPTDPRQAAMVDAILDEAYELTGAEKGGIRATIGHWAGLWPMPGSPELTADNAVQIRALEESVANLVKTYAAKRWVESWAIGNEMNYHVQGGKFNWKVFPADLDRYYEIMTRLAIAGKKAEAQTKPRAGKKENRHPFVLVNGGLTAEEAELFAKYNESSKSEFGGKTTAWDALGVNFYPGVDFENETFYPDRVKADVDALFENAATLNLPVVITEVGFWSDPNGPGKQPDFYEALRPALATQRLLIGSSIFEWSSEGWKPIESKRAVEGRFGIINNARTMFGIMSMNRKMDPRPGQAQATPDAPLAGEEITEAVDIWAEGTAGQYSSERNREVWKDYDSAKTLKAGDEVVITLTSNLPGKIGIQAVPNISAAASYSTMEIHPIKKGTTIIRVKITKPMRFERLTFQIGQEAFKPNNLNVNNNLQIEIEKVEVIPAPAKGGKAGKGKNKSGARLAEIEELFGGLSSSLAPLPRLSTATVDRAIVQKLSATTKAILTLIFEQKLLEKNVAALDLDGVAVEVSLVGNQFLISDTQGVPLGHFQVTAEDIQTARALTSANNQENQDIIASLQQTNTALQAFHAQMALIENPLLAGVVVDVSDIDAMTPGEQAIYIAALLKDMVSLRRLALENKFYYRIVGASDELLEKMNARPEMAILRSVGILSSERPNDASGQRAQELVLATLGNIKTLSTLVDSPTTPAYLPAQAAEAGGYINFKARLVLAMTGARGYSENFARAFAMQLPPTVATDMSDLRVSLPKFLRGDTTPNTLQAAARLALRPLLKRLAEQLRSLYNRLQAVGSSA